MKTGPILLLAVLFYASCKNSNANIELQNDKKVRKALANKWEAKYMETTRARVKVPEEQAPTIAFDENGTFSYGVKNGAIVNKGKWDFDANTHMLHMSIGKDKGPSRVLKLSGKELILVEYMSINDEILDSTVMTYEKR